jgi:hypothetical protein
MGRANRKLASDSIPLATPHAAHRYESGTSGRNVTGLSSRAAELEAKRLQLLKEAVPPSVRSPSCPIPPNRYMPLALESARQGAQMLRVSLTVYPVHDSATLDGAFQTLTKGRPEPSWYRRILFW